VKESKHEAALAFQIKALGLPAPAREFVFAPPRKFRFDFAWPQLLLPLGLEVDGATWAGGRHSRGSGIEKDCEKYSIAAARGWRVIRVVPAQIKSGVAVRWVEEALAYERSR
jgi:very-short-patch-repair endonuclease